ncbi:MAG: helix-turn-helix domain-containing protein [Clostridia bacterium]|nr:helix-turn-helix domain-containing protein [Clostridia bacterium]
MERFQTSERVAKNTLQLNSCGAQILSNSVYSTQRKRIDYSLMYIAAGKAVMRVNGRRIPVYAGEAIFYPPNAKQEYNYLAGGGVNKWIHFSGKLAEPLGKLRSRKIVIRKRKEFESALDMLINAYNSISAQKEMLENGYLSVIIALLLENDSVEVESHVNNRLSSALNQIHIDAFSGVDFDEMAKMCYMGRDRFNHVFKEAVGYSPNKYLIKIRIDRAKQLLYDEGLTVKETAEIVGYTDINYFSRLFKKETGISPKDYKKSETRL